MHSIMTRSNVIERASAKIALMPGHVVTACARSLNAGDEGYSKDCWKLRFLVIWHEPNDMLHQ